MKKAGLACFKEEGENVGDFLVCFGFCFCFAVVVLLVLVFWAFFFFSVLVCLFNFDEPELFEQ